MHKLNTVDTYQQISLLQFSRPSKILEFFARFIEISVFIQQILLNTFQKLKYLKLDSLKVVLRSTINE